MFLSNYILGHVSGRKKMTDFDAMPNNEAIFLQ